MSNSKKKTCTNPGCTRAGQYKCAGCGVAMYCSKECQVGHWNNHKMLCKKSNNNNSNNNNKEDEITFSSLSVKQLKHIIRSKVNDYEDDNERKSILAEMNNMIEKETLITLAEKHIKTNQISKLLSTLQDKSSSAANNMNMNNTSKRSGVKMVKKEQELDMSKATPRQLLEQAAFLRKNPDLVRKSQPSMAHMSNEEIIDAAKQLEDLANNPNMMKEFKESWTKMSDEEKDMLKNITPEQREQIKNLTPEQREQLKNITPEQKKEMMKMAHMNPNNKKNLLTFQEGITNGINDKWITATTTLIKQCPEVFKTMLKVNIF